MFFDRVSELCKKRGTSPSAVAREIGLNNSSATYWKRGSIPKGDTLQKLANYFDVSVDYLLDLTPEEQATLKYVEDYVVKQTGRNRDEVHASILDEKILDIPHEIYSVAVDAADAAVVEAFKYVQDGQLKKYILDDFRFLNRRGKIEAMLRIAELSEDYRFKLNRQPPTSPESTLSTDTTPAPGAPEIPPEGE